MPSSLDPWCARLLEEITRERTRQATESQAPRRHDVLAFGYRYFPHYCALPPSRLHRELCEEFRRVLESPDSERVAIAAPRGNAKTTWVLLIFGLYCIVHDLKRFILLIGATAETANDELAKLKHELEENELLAADFPHACGRGVRWRDNEIVTANDIKVLALGAGKRIRGRKHREARPDAIFLDDAEDDDHVRNKEQRDKTHAWLLKAVLKTKGVARKCDVFLTGTVLHFDSVLARLQDPKQSPGWRSRKYQAVVRWADRQDLWDEWTARYTDWTKPDDARLGDADAFYRAHQADMLAGAEVLWPEGEPYLDLIRLLIDEGRSSFDSEKQNEPIDPSECDFPEEWFEWFDEIEVDGQWWLKPEKSTAVLLAECDIFGACDPSMGKKDKHRDPSAIVRVAAWPARHLWAPSDHAYRRYFVLEASIRRRHPHVILEEIFEMHRALPFQRFGMEAVQFQELYAEDAQRAALDDLVTSGLHFVKLKPRTDKRLRIQKLSPFINYRRIVLHRRKCAELYRQLVYHGQIDHDDGPDALELTLEVAGAIGWVIAIDMPHDPRRAPATAKTTSQQQLEDRIPVLAEHAERAGQYETCGSCTYFEPIRGQATAGRCTARGMTTSRECFECEEWTMREGGVA